MSNIRRFLRYDLTLPIYVELCREDGAPLDFDEMHFIQNKNRAHWSALEQDIAEASGQVAKKNPTMVSVFHNLDRRLNYIFTLLEALSRNENPASYDSYRYMIREERKIQPPNLPEGKIATLIKALYQQSELTFRELRHVVESAKNKLFIFPLNPAEPFDHKAYVLNLEQVAEKGNPIAQLILLLEEKYNLTVTIVQRFKDFYRMRADVTAWPKLLVNLSAGGVGLWHTEPLPLFKPINVFMELDTLFAVQGKVTFARKLAEDSERPWRIGIDFGMLPVEEQRKITLFIQQRELQDTLTQHPTFPGLSAL